MALKKSAPYSSILASCDELCGVQRSDKTPYLKQAMMRELLTGKTRLV